MIRTDNCLHPLEDTAYADDLFSISARREGLQSKADIVSAFTIIFGLKIAIHKLRTFAKCWGEEPSNHTNIDYNLIVHVRDWIPFEIPVTYVADDLDNDSVFKYLGVYIDANNRYRKQYRTTKEMIRKTCEAATYRQASAETITTVMLVSPFRKAAFPGKYCPWSRKELQDLDKPVSSLYKRHLNLMNSTSKAALYMSRDTGGMGLGRLSDQILCDKWAMTWRGLHADLSTRIATEGLLNRALRIGQTSTDDGYSCDARPAGVHQFFTGLLETADACGFTLCKGGSSPQLTASQPILQIFDILLHSQLATKLMHHRILTIGDLMSFPADGPNCWSLPLIHELFPTLIDVLPPLPSDEQRKLRVGQYWSSINLEGNIGHVIEILGFLSPTTFSGRRWVPLIPRETWFTPNINLNARLSRDKIWLRPEQPGKSRGAGSTEEFSTNDLLSGELQFNIVGPEIRSTYLDAMNLQVDGIARQILFSNKERSPTSRITLPPDRMASDDDTWILLATAQSSQQVEVYVDGSMRFPRTALDHAFPQPKTLQTSSYAQGGILFCFDTSIPIMTRQKDITIVTKDGPELGLLLPASIEIYTILLAVHCMEVASLTGTIYTDYIKAVQVANKPEILSKMGREANLPLFEYLLILLERNPGIALRHVKAHGDFKKNKKWTKPQWGNYLADLIAKNDILSFSDTHMEWSLLPLEQIIRKHSKWHWLKKSGHLLLVSLPQALQTTTHLQYMMDRDDYRADRELPIKWQYAKVGLVNDLWKPNKASLKKLAYGYRLIYDKGWHGGNRSKAAPPPTHTAEEWMACGLCGLPDSQHHWIRECLHPETVAVRNAAHDKVLDVLLELRRPTKKAKLPADADLLNIAETLHEFASSAVNGEHLWLGVIYTNMIHHLREQGHDFTLIDAQTTPRANKWKKTVIQVITPLLEAAKEMWQIKESSRRETLLGVLPDNGRVNALRQRQRGDIRSWLMRLEHKVGALAHTTEAAHCIDTTPSAELLRETSTTRTPLRRLAPAIVRPSVPRPQIPTAPRTRWRNTLIQDHFPLNRDNSRKMIRKNLPPNGQMPNLRTLETGRWGNSIDLEWLPPKISEGTQELEESKMETVETDRVVREAYHNNTNNNNDNNNTNSNNNNHTNSFFVCDFCTSSNCFNSLCGSDSRSRSNCNNKEVDDATKRRGVG